jgi:hypothetical protein
MKFGIDIITNERITAVKGLFAKCPICYKPLIAKCGNIQVHHWAHTNLISCDHYWENETEWHREWKSHFDISMQEVVRHDDQTGKKHIADIYNPSKDLVIEFQNSPISLEEMNERELFYKRLIWVINGAKKGIIYTNASGYGDYEVFEKIENKMKRESSSLSKECNRLLQLENENERLKIQVKRKKFSLFNEGIFGQDILESINEMSLIIETNTNEISTLNDKLEEVNQIKFDLMDLYKIGMSNDTFDKKPNKNEVVIWWPRKSRVWKESSSPIFVDIGNNELILMINKYLGKMVSYKTFLAKYASQ